MAGLDAGSAYVLRRSLPRAADPIRLLRQLPSESGARLLLEAATEGGIEESTLILSTALRIESAAEVFRIEASNANGLALLPKLLPFFAGHAPECQGGGAFCLPLGAGRPTPFEYLRLLQRTLIELAPGAEDSIFLAGVFSYELAAGLMGLPAHEGEGEAFPELLFYLADRLIRSSEGGSHNEAILLSFSEGSAEALAVEAEALALSCRAAPAGGEFNATQQRVKGAQLAAVEVDCSDEAFAERVSTLQLRLAEEGLQQVVPSRSFQLPCPDPLRAYAQLRRNNPSPHLFYVETGSQVLFGASPESALRFCGERRRVEIAPIAGTRARGANSVEDLALEAELRSDLKELAEHQMLVELAKREIASVAEGGSCKLEEQMRVERCSHVMHLVSRIAATLPPGKDALHAFEACLVMGTVTGAPKAAAMSLIRDDERSRRGPYGGSLLLLRGNGDLNSALIIRSAWVVEGLAKVRAGAGVVAASIPMEEAAETRRKAAAVLEAILQANERDNQDTVGEAFHGSI